MRKQRSLLTLLLISSAFFIADAQNQELIRLADSLGMILPTIHTNPGKEYHIENLDYGMTIGIERTPGGRIWACTVGGGDNADAFFVLSWSDNDGEDWTNTKVVIDPHDTSLLLKRRTIVGQLWTDPLGRLWLFFDQAMTYFDGRSGNWYTICENPDAESPEWSVPIYLGVGCTLQKPTVMSSGEWVLPVSLWPRSRMNILLEKEWEENPLKGAYPELDDQRGAHIMVSTDQGETWEFRGMVKFPSPSFDEHLVIERNDGKWWMTARTGLGICQSFSTDKGFKWTEPEEYQKHVNSRHFIMRLTSGNLLMVRHGMPDRKLTSRSHLRAFISTDDGKTWQGNLLLDERTGVSYPTGFQAPDGYIYISYDHQRTREGDILMARFNENDVLSERIISRRGELEIQISKPGKVEESAANIAAREKEEAERRAEGTN